MAVVVDVYVYGRSIVSLVIIIVVGLEDFGDAFAEGNLSEGALRVAVGDEGSDRSGGGKVLRRRLHGPR